MNQKKTIHIIGAGFSGLSLACLLSQSEKFDITIFEKNDSIGGMIFSEKTNHGLVEKAANSILLNDEFIEFLEKFNIPYIRPLLSAKARYFYRSKLTKWPLKFSETLFFGAKLIFHLFTSKKYLTPQNNENLHQWGIRNFSYSFAEFILSPAFQGIHAVSSKHLDAELIVGEMLRKKKGKYKGIASGTYGSFDILNSMYEYLKSEDIKFKFNTQFHWDNNLQADYTILCTSLTEASELVKNSEPELYSLLKKTSTNSILTLTAFLKSDRAKPKGFGCLIPENQNLDCLGVLFNNSIFANRSSVDVDSETYIFGGSTAEKIELLSPADLKVKIQSIRQTLFQINNEPLSLHKKMWKNGLPIYNENLSHFQKNYMNYKKNSRLIIHGNYVAGIGLSKILSHSNKIYHQIKTEGIA